MNKKIFLIIGIAVLIIGVVTAGIFVSFEKPQPSYNFSSLEQRVEILENQKTLINNDNQEVIKKLDTGIINPLTSINPRFSVTNISGAEMGYIDHSGNIGALNESYVKGNLPISIWLYNETIATYNLYNNQWSSTYNLSYDVKNTSQWIASGSDIYNRNAGKVGIGSTSTIPLYQLDVNGGIRVYDGYMINFGGNATTMTETQLYRSLNNTLYTPNDFSVAGNINTSGNISVSGRLGIGTSTPTWAFVINGTGDITADANPYTKNKGSTLLLHQSRNAVGSGGTLLFGGMTKGDEYFAGIKGWMTNGNANTTGDLIFMTRSSQGDQNLSEKLRIMGGGNVGIGATDPTTKLYVIDPSVNGSVLSLLGGSSAGGLTESAWMTVQGRATFGYNGSLASVVITDNGATKPIEFINANTRRIYIGTTGNVGINQTNPTHTLNVQGSANITGSLITANITPQNTNLFSIGSSTLRYLKGWFSELDVNGNINASGNITGNGIYGELSWEAGDGTLNVSLPTANTWYNFSNSSTGYSLTGLNNGFTLNNGNSLTAQVSGVYGFNGVIEYSIKSQQELKMTLMVNGVRFVNYTTDKRAPISLNVQPTSVQNVTSMSTFNNDLLYEDGSGLTFNELNGGLPVLEANFTYSNLTDNPILVYYSGYYQGNDAHIIQISAWNFTGNAWVRLSSATTDLPNSGLISYTRVWKFPDSLQNTRKDFINSSNNVKLRIQHTSNGVSSHVLFVDKLALQTRQSLDRQAITGNIRVNAGDNVYVQMLADYDNAMPRIQRFNINLNRRGN